MNTKKALEDFNLDSLDMLEKFHYETFSKSLPKEEALQIIINTVEGDHTQLSEELAKIAEAQQEGYSLL